MRGDQLIRAVSRRPTNMPFNCLALPRPRVCVPTGTHAPPTEYSVVHAMKFIILVVVVVVVTGLPAEVITELLVAPWFHGEVSRYGVCLVSACGCTQRCL